MSKPFERKELPYSKFYNLYKIGKFFRIYGRPWFTNTVTVDWMLKKCKVKTK